MLDLNQCTERHHLSKPVLDVKISNVSQLAPVVRLRLHAYLQALVEFVELVHIGRSEISLQRREYIVDRNPQRVCHRAVDIQVELRTAVAEGRESSQQKTRLAVRSPNHLIHGLL